MPPEDIDLLRLRPSKFTSVHWTAVSLAAIVLVPSWLFLPIKWGLPRILNGLLLMTALGLLGVAATFFNMRFPIIRLNREKISFQVAWQKINVELCSIDRVTKERGFASKDVLGRWIVAVRPYYRIEIHYRQDGKKRDVDFNLMLFRKREVEALLTLLKELRPNLEMPILDKRGL